MFYTGVKLGFSHHMGRTKTEGICKQSAEKNIQK